MKKRIVSVILSSAILFPTISHAQENSKQEKQNQRFQKTPAVQQQKAIHIKTELSPEIRNSDIKGNKHGIQYSNQERNTVKAPRNGWFSYSGYWYYMMV
ncbi:hypothetical protein [Bacillus pseudomycoides]|uniref:hypothetical protein n=1 Tax=Bacillus pseudomycoides TaxID=64104 RepID=UPI003393E206